ncbi:hypothetical protein EGW08_000910, partial [Elysia chlorotica]
EQRKREERERQEKEEKARNRFVIPKKKPEPLAVDKQQLIDSLFDDAGADSPELEEGTDTAKRKLLETKSVSNHSSPKDSSSGAKHSSSKDSSSGAKHSSSKDSSSGAKHSSSKDSSSGAKHSSSKDSSSSNKHSSSHSSLKHSSSGSKHSSSSSSSSKHSSPSVKQSSSSSLSSSSHKSTTDGKSLHLSSKDSIVSSKSSSSSKQLNSSSSSSTSKSKSSHSSSKSSKEGSSSSHQSSKTSSKNLQNQETSSSKTNKTLSASTNSSDYKNPIPLTKNHLNPIQERHADNPQLSEKAKILAKLQAIKERTMAAIAMENEAKNRRVRGAKTHRRSKHEEMNEKAKSAEIVKDAVSSDEENGNDMPSALDIMLSERNAKLEKEKIARMAKQAWERATKGEVEKSGEDSNRHRVRKHKSERRNLIERKNKSSLNKAKRDGKTSPFSERSTSKQEGLKPKKPVIVRHANRAPPPMDFKAILAIAEKKSAEPVNSAALLTIPKKKKDEARRPMTQEEKDRMERRKTREYQDWLKYGGKQPKDNRRSSISDDEDDEKKPLSTPGSKPIPKPADLTKAKPVGTSSAQRQGPPKPAPKQPSNHRNITVNENLLVCGDNSDDDKSEDGVDAVGSNPFDKIMKQVHRKRPMLQPPGKPAKRMRIDSEEEEEDSDMDDFIDDGDDPTLDVSKEIQSMFGYDRSRYKNERDDDLSDMEANFSTVMAEEKRSAKLGLMEDLEDIRREEEELRRKAALKKMRSKK